MNEEDRLAFPLTGPKLVLIALGLSTVVAGVTFLAVRPGIDGKLFGAAFTLGGLAWLVRAGKL